MNETLQDKYAAQNSEQTVALEDGFSLSRYAQFARHLPEGTETVLDVGCAEGRGSLEVPDAADPAFRP